MATWIVLLRGINVGGANKLPMKELAQLLQKTGSTNIRTYIQSGNVVLENAARSAAPLAQQIASAIARRHRFEPRVLAFTRNEFENAARANPFVREANADPQRVHLYFLAAAPNKPDLAALRAACAAREQFVLGGKVLYLYTPDGFGRSKLAERAERLLGVAATARNWRTVTALVEMASET